MAKIIIVVNHNGSKILSDIEHNNRIMYKFTLQAIHGFFFFYIDSNHFLTLDASIPNNVLHHRIITPRLK